MNTKVKILISFGCLHESEAKLTDFSFLGFHFFIVYDKCR